MSSRPLRFLIIGAGPAGTAAATNAACPWGPGDARGESGGWGSGPFVGLHSVEDHDRHCGPDRLDAQRSPAWSGGRSWECRPGSAGPADRHHHLRHQSELGEPAPLPGGRDRRGSTPVWSLRMKPRSTPDGSKRRVRFRQVPPLDRFRSPSSRLGTGRRRAHPHHSGCLRPGFGAGADGGDRLWRDRESSSSTSSNRSAPR